MNSGSPGICPYWHCVHGVGHAQYSSKNACLKSGVGGRRELVMNLLCVAGRDAWSHAYQPGEIKNITQEEAVAYMVNRGVNPTDAEQLVKVPHPLHACPTLHTCLDLWWRISFSFCSWVLKRYISIGAACDNSHSAACNTARVLHVRYSWEYKL